MTTQQLSGKARAILQRLPHFYDPQDAGELLIQFVNLFGRSLERAEADIYRVLRAHHVETADNVGSRGYTAPSAQRGDLDKIFALYLEAIGGTTQLVKMNPYFSKRSLQVARLVPLLYATDSEFVARIKTRFRFSTHTLLAQYNVASSQFRATDIQPGFVLALSLGRACNLRNSRSTITTYVRSRLTETTRALLNAYTGSPEPDPRLTTALVNDLNQRVLRDPGLYRKNADAFDLLELDAATWSLLRGIYRDFLRQRYADEPDSVKQASLLFYLDQAEVTANPPGDDQVRLNRLLLDSAFAHDANARPWGFASRQTPTLDDLRTALVDEFNHLLEGEELFQPDGFPELADDYPALRQRHQNNTVWLNRLVLETAFPTAIEKSYTPYQERMRGLIQVLRQGASTRAGIIALVAANLGIVEDTPAARQQRQRIRIEEFNPVQATQTFSGIQPYSRFVETNPHSLVRVNNPNLYPVTPEFNFAVFMQGQDSEFAVFSHWSIMNRTTGQTIFYDGSLHHGDGITLSSAGMAINGLPTRYTGEALILPPGESVLQIAAMTGLTAARFDRTLFDLTAYVDDDVPLEMTNGRLDETSFDQALFDRATLDHLLPEQVANVMLDIEISMTHLTPAQFRVDIPWDLGDFPTDPDDPASHPRNQIRGIVDKVKAAGVFATINYEKLLADTHELGELELMRRLQQPAVTNRMPVTHAISDRLHIAGVLDYTEFDSLNGFA
jgi:hypothetical protein